MSTCCCLVVCLWSRWKNLANCLLSACYLLAICLLTFKKSAAHKNGFKVLVLHCLYFEYFHYWYTYEISTSSLYQIVKTSVVVARSIIYFILHVAIKQCKFGCLWWFYTNLGTLWPSHCTSTRISTTSPCVLLKHHFILTVSNSG